jgi:aspartate aminotransferase-like enzyme
VLQGYNARPQNVELVVAAFRDALAAQGFSKNAGGGAAAAAAGGMCASK